MSKDRAVQTDALQTLGTIITNGGRDAIHLAVEPVTAGESLQAGLHIGIEDGRAYATRDCKKLGIVDPFLTQPVEEGEMFWLIVYPRQITSLRHVWSHPDFPEEGISMGNKAESEAWLRNFCATADCPNYEYLIECAMKDFEFGGFQSYENCRLDEDYLHFGGVDAHGSIPYDFWRHLEVVTGKTFEVKPNHFSCSC